MGLVHIYFGDGKGKTTAALGLALRALGDGLRVCVCQFLKGAKSGEIEALERFENAVLLRAEDGSGKFLWQMDEEERAACLARQRALLERAAAADARSSMCSTKRSTPRRQGRFRMETLLERTEALRERARSDHSRAMKSRRRCFPGRIT